VRRKCWGHTRLLLSVIAALADACFAALADCLFTRDLARACCLTRLVDSVCLFHRSVSRFFADTNRLDTVTCYDTSGAGSSQRTFAHLQY
jgi:hypothetical protein